MMRVEQEKISERANKFRLSITLRCSILDKHAYQVYNPNGKITSFILAQISKLYIHVFT